MRTKEEIKNQIDKLKSIHLDNRYYKECLLMSTDMDDGTRSSLIASIDIENMCIENNLDGLFWVLNEKN